MSGKGGARRPEPDGDVDPATPARGCTPPDSAQPDSAQPDSAHSHVLPPPAEASGIAEHREQLAVRHQVAADQLREMAQRNGTIRQRVRGGANDAGRVGHAARAAGCRATAPPAVGHAGAHAARGRAPRSLRANPAHGALPRVGRLRLLRGPSVRYIGVRAACVRQQETTPSPPLLAGKVALATSKDDSEARLST